MLRYALLLFMVTTIISSCKTDLNLTGPYEERALVYALVDPLDNPIVGGNGHLFRIQKSFLGEASAFDMALVPDSNYFNPSTTTVQVLEILDNDTVNTWTLDTITIFNKEIGDPTDGTVDFFGPKQRLYKLEENLLVDHSYLLRVENQRSGYTATATLDMINTTSFGWINPSQGNATYRGINLISNTGEYRGFGVTFSTVTNAARYELWLRFFYREVVGTDTTQKTLTWRVKSESFPRTDNGGTTSGNFSIPGEEVFSFIGANIEAKEGVTRILGKSFNTLSGTGNKVGPDAFELRLHVAGTEFSEMLRIAQGNQSVVLTDVPSYSNINNGLGIFSTRSLLVFPHLVPNDAANIQEFISGQYTGDLDFTIDD